MTNENLISNNMKKMAENSDDKSIIMQIVNHIGEQEKHFNGLETQYRLLASTWLLASFSGIGFLLQSDKSIIIDRWLLTGFIGLIGSLGIFLLWIMDIKVYHQLLHCAFIEGVKLEMKFPWLPKVRTEMLKSHETGEVTASTGLYYICSTSLLLIVSIASFFIYTPQPIFRVIICIIGAGILWIQFWYMRHSVISKKAIAILEELNVSYK